MIPLIDFETYSEAGYIWTGKKWQGVMRNKSGLEAVGAAVYAEHPATFIRCLAYDGPNGPQLWTPEQPEPQWLLDHIRSGGIVEAHNSEFEFYIWYCICHLRMGWPPLPLHQLRCSMSKARAASLPGALEKVAEVLQVAEQKDTRGKTLIRKLCVPRNPTKRDPSLRCDDPAALAELGQYCVQDIRAERAVSEACPDLSPHELDVWLLDQQINFRGAHIDRPSLMACKSIVEQAHRRYNEELQDITHGAIQAASELQKIQGWLAASGVVMPTMDSDAVDNALKRSDLPSTCRRVLEIRSTLGAASVKKLFAIEHRLCSDSRLRGLFAYCGADRTGRFAGRGPQPQNLTSGGPPVAECPQCGGLYWNGLHTCRYCGTLRPEGKADWGIKAVEQALADIHTLDLSTVEYYWSDAVAAVSGCLRGLFSAAPGCDLLCSDYSAIEAVGVAEIAGEEWRQDVFRTHGKIYEMSASKICGIPFDEFLRYKQEHGQHHPMRKKVGKVAELASAYGGGRAAWVVFGADEFMTDDEISQNVRIWRQENQMIKALWYGVQDAAFMAVQNPGYCYQYQAAATRFTQPPAIVFGVRGDILYCRLPSGRNLTYHSPRLLPDTDWNGRPSLRLTYMGWNSDYKKGPKGWMRLDTWGGKLVENIVQAACRDLLVYAMLQLDRAGYPIVMHVHDEIVAEVLSGTGDIGHFEQVMSGTPQWAAGWPVKAAGGWRGLRYRKD